MNTVSIFVISLGGTWMMKNGTVPPNPLTQSDFLAIAGPVDGMTHKGHQSHIEFEEVARIDSTNMVPADWTRAILRIRGSVDRVDGVLVLTGTDTLSYVASALSFGLLGLGKPVVVSGAMVEHGEVGTDAVSNIGRSLKVVMEMNSRHRSSVVVVFGRKVILGVRAQKFSADDYEAFRSASVPPVGFIRPTGVYLDDWSEPRLPQGWPSGSQIAEFAGDVRRVYLSPTDQDVEGLRRMVDSLRALRGVVLGGYGQGNIPGQYHSHLEDLTQDNGQLIVLTSECPDGRTTGYYSVSHDLDRFCIKAGDMITETALVKLTWLLALEKQNIFLPEAKRQLTRRDTHGRDGRFRAFMKSMTHDFCGEISS